MRSVPQVSTQIFKTVATSGSPWRAAGLEAIDSKGDAFYKNIWGIFSPETQNAMEDFTAKQVQNDFVSPLIQLIGEFTDDLKMWDRVIAEKKAPHEFIPLNMKSAKKGINFIRKARRELRKKLDEIDEGSFLWRGRELEKMREKYRQKKEEQKK